VQWRPWSIHSSPSAYVNFVGLLYCFEYSQQVNLEVSCGELWSKHIHVCTAMEQFVIGNIASCMLMFSAKLQQQQCMSRGIGTSSTNDRYRDLKTRQTNLCSCSLPSHLPYSPRSHQIRRVIECRRRVDAFSEINDAWTDWWRLNLRVPNPATGDALLVLFSLLKTKTK